MLIAALVLNVPILVLVLWGLARDGMDDALGPDTVARRIQACVYFAIAAVSTFLIGLHLLQMQRAVPMTVALFMVQMAYKLASVAAVGLRNPVAATNLAVVFVQGTAIAVSSGSGG